MERFIPACAGNSALESYALKNKDGSSPRVRGTRHARGASRPASSVHPRVCGELDGKLTPETLATGSSPRVRGTLLQLPT